MSYKLKYTGQQVEEYLEMVATGQAGGTVNYNDLGNVPIVNQDLLVAGFTPVVNTYYKHSGETTDAFTQGVIYLYDGTTYKALTGDIPSKTSQLENDSNFVTKVELPIKSATLDSATNTLYLTL